MYRIVTFITRFFRLSRSLLRFVMLNLQSHDAKYLHHKLDDYSVKDLMTGLIQCINYSIYTLNQGYLRYIWLYYIMNISIFCSWYIFIFTDIRSLIEINVQWRVSNNGTVVIFKLNYCTQDIRSAQHLKIISSAGILTFSALRKWKQMPWVQFRHLNGTTTPLLWEALQIWSN